MTVKEKIQDFVQIKARALNHPFPRVVSRHPDVFSLVVSAAAANVAAGSGGRAAALTLTLFCSAEINGGCNFNHRRCRGGLYTDRRGHC